MTVTSTTPHHLATDRAAGATRNPLLALVRTEHDRVALALRLVLGLVILPHGAQKLLGWFGGYGFEGTMGYFTGALGIPTVVAFLVILAESVGALALVAGFLGRVSAAGIALVMAGAVWTSHLQHGFFMNWSGQQAGEGFEYHLLATALAVAVIVRGSGAWSLDRLLARRAAR